MPKAKDREINNAHSADDRMDAAIAYVCMGSSKGAARITGIPASTIRQWTNMDWWPDLIIKVHNKNDKKLQAHLTKMIDLAFGKAQIRLEQGDPVIINKQLEYKPVSAWDATKIGATLMDKRALINSRPRGSQKIKNEKDRTNKLKEQYGNIGKDLEEESSNDKALH